MYYLYTLAKSVWGGGGGHRPTAPCVSATACIMQVYMYYVSSSKCKVLLFFGLSPSALTSCDNQVSHGCMHFRGTE